MNASQELVIYLLHFPESFKHAILILLIQKRHKLKLKCFLLRKILIKRFISLKPQWARHSLENETNISVIPMEWWSGGSDRGALTDLKIQNIVVMGDRV